MWQLNDCWPATSWAIVDYFLRKKGAYYTISRALRPVVVGVKREHHDWSVCHARPAKSSSYKVWVSSNLTTKTKVDLKLRFVPIDAGKDIKSPLNMENCDVNSNGTTTIISCGCVNNISEDPHVLSARIFSPGSEGMSFQRRGLASTAQIFGLFGSRVTDQCIGRQLHYHSTASDKRFDHTRKRWRRPGR